MAGSKLSLLIGLPFLELRLAFFVKSKTRFSAGFNRPSKTRRGFGIPELCLFLEQILLGQPFSLLMSLSSILDEAINTLRWDYDVAIEWPKSFPLLWW